MEFPLKYIPTLQYLLLSLLLVTITTDCTTEAWRSSCVFDDAENVVCENVHFETIPSDWPTTIFTVTIVNCSLTKLQKQAFKRYPSLEEITIRNCGNLAEIEKQAFKGLNSLRLLTIEDNSNLSNISKGAFSLISSKQRLKVFLHNNGFEVLNPGTFRHITQLRELSISGKQCLKLKSGSFAGLMQIDFFSLNNVCEIEASAFRNSTRIYRFNISNSRLTLSKRVFFSISHSNEIRLANNQIPTIGVDAFFGLDTVERLVLSANKIGNISSHAFSSIVNIGELVIEENQIRYIDPESLQSTAWRTKFRDNYIECNCANQWIKYIKDTYILKHNFCGAEESFRTLTNYIPRCDKLAQSSSTYNASAVQTLVICIAFLVVMRLKTIFPTCVS